MTERLHFHFSLSCIGEGTGNPLQCSCLENPRDGGAWWAAVNGVAQSRTRLKRLSSSSSSSRVLLTQSYFFFLLSLGRYFKIQEGFVLGSFSPALGSELFLLVWWGCGQVCHWIVPLGHVCGPVSVSTHRPGRGLRCVCWAVSSTAAHQLRSAISLSFIE